MRINKGIAIVLVALMLLFLTACREQDDLSEDKTMMMRYLKYFDYPDILQIQQLDKYIASDAEVYYYIKWVYPEGGDLESYDHLIVYNRNTTLIDLAYFGDMESGLEPRAKEEWEKLKDKQPDHTFTESEIETLKQTAIKHNK